ncbi:hypothetical protein [Teredinibacter turnerae]|uniref:hypothetical protein n=1 Tax=Teredinibacter turnerae TaxID=2426 RepID=UPI00036BA584|nr:hypothetical protein [Teredinibacter turnerae]
MALTNDEKRVKIASIVEGLEELRADVVEAVEYQKASDMYPPEFDADDFIDNVVDALNALDHELKHG